MEKNIDDREVSDRVGSGVDKLYSPSASKAEDGRQQPREEEEQSGST